MSWNADNLKMTSKRLRRIPLSQTMQERLLYHNFSTAKDVLSKSPYELVKGLGVGFLTAKKLLVQVASSCAPCPKSCLDLWQCYRDGPRYLSTSLPELDQVLHGGLPVATITEVAGPSGCGKTQFCIMLCILATLSRERGGLEGGVVYIDTESAFSAERLIEMAQAKFPGEFPSDEELFTLTKNIHIMRESSCASLLQRLETLEDFLISHKIRLVILDSVASLVRKEFDGRTGKNMAARTNLLAREAAILKKIAEEFSLPVFVTNQITTRYGSSPGPTKTELGNTQQAEEFGYVTAALGNTWSHCVNTRLILQYLGGRMRQVMVAKSPVAPFASFSYTVEAAGLVLQEGGADHYEGTDPGLQKIQVRTSIAQDPFNY